MSLEIVHVDAAGSALLAALHGQCFSKGWDKDAFAKLLAMPGTFALVLSPDTMVAGGAGSVVAPPVGFALARAIGGEAGGEAEIITLGVLPDRRAKGAGAALVAAVAAKVRDMAWDMAGLELFLEVAADNIAAIALYEKTGFRPVGRRKNYYQDNNSQENAGADASNVSAVDAIVMRRDL